MEERVAGNAIWQTGKDCREFLGTRAGEELDPLDDIGIFWIGFAHSTSIH